MLNLFFDTSALVKMFQKEAGSDIIIELIQRDNVNLRISELARLELVSALYRRFRMHELTKSQLECVLDIIDEELKHFQTEPLGKGVLTEAERLIKMHGTTIGLRTLDALHIATFLLIAEKDWKFVVADKVLSQAACKLNITVFNPLENIKMP